MKTLVCITALVILMLTACSSTKRIETQYYLLDSPTLASAEPIEVTKSKPTILVTVATLPEYLQQTNLLLQLSDHQLHFAKFHQWAEPLQVGLVNSLVRELNKDADKNHYQATTDIATPSYDGELKLVVTAFQPTHQSQAMFSGHYTLNSFQSNSVKKQQAFHLTVPLNADGYHHAVMQLRQLVQQLAAQIRRDLIAIAAQQSAANTK
ncbi:hypothetical protein SAMN05216262_11953 [Colwellia chukchiensis]|uniref:ABC-type transport auxiliary lipoprotein component domain-containing protein n=1 Tax=Colwellia chukchiensis TaxID=641665 RepID=A0A1H7SLQ9_9GAMM|nr:PqiC family protein [Colwellia chukchiensis]SEL73408.1 hypothetical protein SAMN05216262_11953 [Colwellia chukchiensis]